MGLTLVVGKLALLVFEEEVPNADIGNVHIREGRLERHGRQSTRVARQRKITERSSRAGWWEQ
jgi:hypothetical protein